jgi:hypothetical protein
VAANPNASAATLRELAADQDDFIWFIASITYLLLILYVCMRSALVALPLLILFVVNTSSDYAAMKPFLDRAVRLVSYLPPGMAEAYDQEADNAITVSLVYLSRVFIGNPGPNDDRDDPERNPDRLASVCTGATEQTDAGKSSHGTGGIQPTNRQMQPGRTKYSRTRSGVEALPSSSSPWHPFHT